MYIAFLLSTGILLGAGLVLALLWRDVKKARAYDKTIKLPCACTPEVEKAWYRWLTRADR